jgi:hypothetical protein
LKVIFSGNDVIQGLGSTALLKKPKSYDYTDSYGRIGKVENRPPAKVDKVHHGTVPQLIIKVAAGTAQRHAKCMLGNAPLKEIPLLHNQADGSKERRQNHEQQEGSAQQNAPRISHTAYSYPRYYGRRLPLGQTVADQPLSELIKDEKNNCDRKQTKKHSPSTISSGGNRATPCAGSLPLPEGEFFYVTPSILTSASA